MECKDLLAERIRTEENDYKFGKIKEAKAFALSQLAMRKVETEYLVQDNLTENHGYNNACTRDRIQNLLIDFGIGEADTPADPGIVAVLAREAGLLENRRYADNGILDFQEAACNYLREYFDVEGLDPARNLLHGVGSKSILAMLPMCLINPGDVALVTVPGYPIISTQVRYLGGEVYPLPLLKKNQYLPDFSMIPEDICRRAKLLYLNYPNNPTGATATREFFEAAITFAKEHNLFIIHDAAYAAITYEDARPLSFLSIPGAIEVGVEVHSLSKSFQMTGWRLAFLAGNETLVQAYGKVKNNTDCGQFMAIQKAGIYALTHLDITKRACAKYEHRIRLLVSCLCKAGFQATAPKGSFYCYVAAPISAGSTGFTSGEEAADYILRHAFISTVPWDDAGAMLRFSITFENNGFSDEAIIEEAERRLLALCLTFSGA